MHVLFICNTFPIWQLEQPFYDLLKPIFIIMHI
jgi:hypothetical protein